MAWVNGNVFHRKSYWLSSDSPHFSEAIRGMLHLKPILVKFLRCDVKNGLSASFWFDSWTDLGPPIDFVGQRGPTQLHIAKNATVQDAVLNGHWNFSSARSEEI